MNLNEFMDVLERTTYIYIATADKYGLPHLDTVKTVKMKDNDELILREWLTDGTVVNLSENKMCTLLVWDEAMDKGFQVKGVAQRMQDLAFLDGYELCDKEKYALPQVLWEIHIRVNKILDFRHAPKDKVRVITSENEPIKHRLEHMFRNKQ